MAERIPFVDNQATGLDELAGAGQESFNVVVDDLGSLRRRPGLLNWSAALITGGIDGLHATVNGDIYALGATPPNRQLYKLTEVGSSAIVGADLVGSSRPVVAETESILALTAGDIINKYVFATNETSVLGGSPPKASHVLALTSRLVANDIDTDKTKVHFSSQALGSSFAGFEEWNGVGASGFFTAEARPDPVIAIAETTNELFVWGTTTLQVYAPDATFGFAPVSTREYGLGAIYSIVKFEQSFAYLDHRRRIVIGDGRSQEVISAPIQRKLDEMTSISDCFGFRVTIGPTDALCWTFPETEQTYVFQKGSGWGQWQSWDDTTDNWTPLDVNVVTHNPITNETLAGMRDGRTMVFKTGHTLDNDRRIVARVTSGFINRKTDRRKHCKKVRITLRRGETIDPLEGSEPQAWLRWRDQPGPWAGELPVMLGISPDTHPVVEFPSLGVYRRRQWQFEFSGTEDLVLTEASEDFEVLAD